MLYSKTENAPRNSAILFRYHFSYHYYIRKQYDEDNKDSELSLCRDLYKYVVTTIKTMI